MVHVYTRALLIILLLTANQVWSAQFCGKEFDFEQIEWRLKTEQWSSKTPMDEFLRLQGRLVHFTSEVYLIELASGTKAVLKIADPSWPRDAIAEVAAYKASQLLGMHLVPPTVLYAKDGLVGSLQYYVEPSFDLLMEGNYERAKERVSPEDLANIELFYFLFGQWDPGPSNLIAVEEGEGVYFALIDNAAIGYTQKCRYGEHPFVLCFPDTVFPKEQSEGAFPFHRVRLLPPDISLWEKEFGSVLSPMQIKEICKMKWSPVAFVIWQEHFWRQYRFGSPSYTDYYPPETMKKMMDLNLESLRMLFDNDLGFLFRDHYYESILERRDQLAIKFIKS